MAVGRVRCWIYTLYLISSPFYLASIMAIPILDIDINSVPVDFDRNRTAIGSISAFPEGSPCKDDLGQERAEGSAWTSVSGCDRNYCVHGWKSNYTLSYKCRSLGEVENRNTVNCFVTSDKSVSFPHCCPRIDCERRDLVSTPSPPVCRDISPGDACDIWANQLEGCLPTSSVYNITAVYCRVTCGFCSP